MILEGQDYARGVFIFTDEPEAVSQKIMETMNRGISGFRGKGMYTGNDRDILYVVVSRRELSRLTETVKNVDTKAFIVVQNVYEVLGNGFPRR